MPIVGNTAARVIGVKVSEFKGNGKLIAQAEAMDAKVFSGHNRAAALYSSGFYYKRLLEEGDI